MTEPGDRHRSETVVGPAAYRSDIQDFVADFRRQVMTSLPGALRRALDTYSRYAAEVPSDDAKAFAGYQGGCRAALSHVHLLLKLAHWTVAGDVSTGSIDADLDRLIREAEAALPLIDRD